MNRGGSGGGVSTSSTNRGGSAEGGGSAGGVSSSSTKRGGPSGGGGAAQARQNIRATSNRVEPQAPEEEPSRDDESVEEESANHDELLAKHLGAELIAEED